MMWMKTRRFLCAALIFMAACGQQAVSSSSPADSAFSQSHEELKAVDPSLQGYYYSFLDEEGQRAYDEIYEACARFSSSVELTPLPAETYLVVSQAFTMDHPEFYWTCYGSQYYVGLAGKVSRATFRMQGDEKEKLAEMDGLAEGIIRSIPYDATTYTKLKYIYEYIIWNTEYDASQAENDALGQDITSVFFDHRSVCAGYAKAFLYLCNKAGIQSALVIGDASNMTSGAHAWNIVRIASQWYWVDVTWGDPVVEGSVQTISYNYFCVDDQTIGIDHVIDPTLSLGSKGLSFQASYPSCLDNSRDWFHLNGSYFESYDPEVVRKYLKGRLESGHVFDLGMRFADDASLQEAIHDLIDNYAVFDIIYQAGVQTETVSYTTNDKLHILTITAVVKNA